MTVADQDVIRATGVRRSYGKFEAVRGVDFAVARGELFALLGTNGAGKTSTLELLEGLARPDGGEVRVLGCDPYRERVRVRPHTGVMLQEGGLPSQLTVAETVRLWAGLVPRPRPEAEALGQVGLAGRRDVRVAQLSGGERRRLDLALALLGRPEVLFLDEPTTGLDAEGRRATWELVRELRAEGTTVLLTTHYLEEAEELADRLAIMHGGEIAVAGSVADIVGEHPATVSFRLPPGLLLGDLPPLPELGVTGHEAHGEAVRLRTGDLQRTLTGLLLWARDADVELAGIDARSASLEEAFLRIAGQPSAADDAALASAGTAGTAGAASTAGTVPERSTR